MRVLSVLLCLLSAGACAEPIESQYPPPGASQVPRNTSLVFRFKSGTELYRLRITLTQVSNGANVPLQQETAYGDGLTEFILVPSQALLASTTYSVKITTPAVISQSTFRTGASIDTTPPRLVAVSPAPATRGVDPFGPFRYEFDKPLLRWMSATSLSDGTGSTATSETRVILSPSRTSIEVWPFYQYRVPPIVQVQLDASRIRDASGNALGGSPITHRFFTSLLGDAQVTMPLGQYPEPGETGVPTNAMVQLMHERTLSEAAIRAGGIVLETRGQSLSFQPEIRGQVVRLTRVTLLPDTTYRVRTTDLLKDFWGLPVAPLSYDFTTGSGPDPGTDSPTSGPGSTVLAPVNTRFVMRSPRRLPSFSPQLAKMLAPPQSDGTAFVQWATEATLSPNQRVLTITPRYPLPAWGNVSLDLSSITDITGQQVSYGLRFSTSDSNDLTPPEIITLSPSAGATEIPVGSSIQILLNEPVGLMTPDDAIRVSRDGEPVAGRISLPNPDISVVVTNPHLIAFQPAQPLDPDTDYDVEVVGVRDVAANELPRQTSRFRTGPAAAKAPGNYPQLVRTNVLSGYLDPSDAIEVEYDSPLRAASCTATVSIPVPQPNTSPVLFDHPIRIEVAGSLLRVVPQLPWPSDRGLYLQVFGADIWGRQVSYSADFAARGPAGDQRPAVVSFTPPSGTTIGPSQPIRVTFSMPMLNASTANGGLLVRQGSSQIVTRSYWSDDRREIIIIPLFANATSQTNGDPVSVVVSANMTDLGGNPLQAATAQFPVGPLRILTRIPSILDSNPPRGISMDPRSPLTLYLSAPVDAEQMNRALWIATSQGRARGLWEVAAGGRMAVFRPQFPWPGGSSARLIQVEPVIDLTYEWRWTVPGVPTTLTVSRTSIGLFGGHPADAVIEVEFNQDVPAGVSPVILAGLAFDEIQPRARVRRLIPRSPLVAGSTIQLQARPGVAITFPGASALITAPTATATSARFRAPVPGATAVPRNARPSIVFNGRVNPLSLTESTVRILLNGAPLPTRLSASSDPMIGVTVTPLGPLPADEVIEVRLEGVEDLWGRPLPTDSWTFRTSSDFDLSGPRLLYSNAGGSKSGPLHDPQAPIRAEFDEPLSPAALPAMIAGYRSFSDLLWDLTGDLRTLLIVPSRGWNRGESYNFMLSPEDLAGNRAYASPDVQLRAAFDRDRSPLSLTGMSIPDGQTDVPLNTIFAFRFSKPVSIGEARNIQLRRGSETIPLTSRLESQPERIVLIPVVPLSPNATYQLAVDGVSDSYGNKLDRPATVNFTTGERVDVAGPSMTVRTGDATDPIRVTFSELVDPTSVPAQAVRLEWIDWRGGSGYRVTVAVDLSWSADRRELIITPRKALSPGTKYTLTFSAMDLAGNAGSSSRDFTLAAEDRAPVRITVVPPDGSADVPLNALIQVVFSRPVPLPPIRLYEDDVEVPARVQLMSIQRKLQPNRRYRIEVDGFIDDRGNEIPVLRSSFTTGAITDFTAPQLISSSPANNEAGVAIDVPWLLNFSETIYPLVYLDSNVRASREMPFRVSTGVSGSQLSLTPSPSWPAAASLELSIPPRTHFGTPSVTDLANNRLRGQINLSFKTAAVNDPVPPILESATPPAGTIISGDSATITLRFSKPVMLPADGLRVFYGSQPSDVRGMFDAEFRTVTLALRPPANSRVTIVGSDAIRDNADNPVEPFILEYPTGENRPGGAPKPTLAEPRDSATDVPAASAVTIRFDRAMDTASVLQSIRLTQNGENVAGSTAALEDGRTYRFTPSAPFSARAQVRVFILAGAADIEGRAYSPDPSGYFATFFIASGSTSPLSVLRRGFPVEAEAGATLEVAFNADLDPASIGDDSVWLRSGSRLVAGRASLRSGRILQFTPAHMLQPGSNYVLTAGSALRGLDGQWFAGQDFGFTVKTGEAPPVDIESVEPAEWMGQPALRVRFTAAVSPLAGSGIRVEAAGRAVSAQVLASTSGREFLVVPSETGGALAVSLDEVPDASGRMLAPRRIALPRKESR